ncbi:hypothetical protein [Hominifimenecus sp. rT4P-3]|uniref:hypothetical protein n=1 Tax=Hominifimenecus sp. rT4P-3 TaxID=3242979 RepID=UPI003DA25018
MNKICAWLEQEEHQKRNLILWSILLVLISRLLFYGVFLVYESINGTDGNFWIAMNQWDSGWYIDLVQNGYAKGPASVGGLLEQENWAFFPLAPICIGFLYSILGGNLCAIAGIVMSAVTVGILVLIYYYFQETKRSVYQAVATQIFVAAGLYSFYFASFYTEAFYLFLLLLTLYFLQKKRYLAMGIAGALLSAARNTGIMVVFAIAVKVIADYFQNGETHSVKGFFENTLGNWRLVLGTCLIPSGLFSFMLYLGLHMGDPLAFLHVQAGWGIGEKNAFLLIWDGLTSGEWLWIYFSVWALAGIGLILYLLFEKRWEEAVLAGIFLFIPLGVRLHSIPRYIIGAGLFTFSAGDFLQKRAKNWMTSLFLAGCIVTNFMLLYYWFCGKNWLT